MLELRQWKVVKGRPPGFEREHWFVIISSDERCRESRLHQVNALACFTLRGTPTPRDVVLDQADGLEMPTVCACDFLFILNKAGLHSPAGTVSWERQQQIKAKMKALLRL